MVFNGLVSQSNGNNGERKTEKTNKAKFETRVPRVKLKSCSACLSCLGRVVVGGGCNWMVYNTGDTSIRLCEKNTRKYRISCN